MELADASAVFPTVFRASGDLSHSRVGGVRQAAVRAETDDDLGLADAVLVGDLLVFAVGVGQHPLDILRRGRPLGGRDVVVAGVLVDADRVVDGVQHASVRIRYREDRLSPSVVTLVVRRHDHRRRCPHGHDEHDEEK